MSFSRSETRRRPGARRQAARRTGPERGAVKKTATLTRRKDLGRGGVMMSCEGDSPTTAAQRRLRRDATASTSYGYDDPTATAKRC